MRTLKYQNQPKVHVILGSFHMLLMVFWGGEEEKASDSGNVSGRQSLPPCSLRNGSDSLAATHLPGRLPLPHRRGAADAPCLLPAQDDTAGRGGKNNAATEEAEAAKPTGKQRAHKEVRSTWQLPRKDRPLAKRDHNKLF